MAGRLISALLWDPVSQSHLQLTSLRYTFAVDILKVCIVFTVIIQMVGRGGQRLVIVNLQATPLDYCCKLRIFAKCDDVSKMLMSKLGVEIPEFRLKR